MTVFTTKVSRRTALACGVAGAAMVSVPGVVRQARAAEFTYKFGHRFPLVHPFHTFLQAAAGGSRERSSGRFEMQIFGNSQLGGDTQMLSQVRANAIQFFC